MHAGLRALTASPNCITLSVTHTDRSMMSALPKRQTMILKSCTNSSPEVTCCASVLYPLPGGTIVMTARGSWMSTKYLARSRMSGSSKITNLKVVCDASSVQ